MLLLLLLVDDYYYSLVPTPLPPVGVGDDVVVVVAFPFGSIRTPSRNDSIGISVDHTAAVAVVVVVVVAHGKKRMIASTFRTKLQPML